MMDENLFEDLLNDFAAESEERTERIEENLLQILSVDLGKRDDVLVILKRELHTLKGNAGMMGLMEIQSLVHDIENMVAILDIRNPDIDSVLASLDEVRRLTKKALNSKESAGDFPGESDDSVSKTQATIRVQFSTLDSLVELLAEMVVAKNRLSENIETTRTVDNPETAWRSVMDSGDALGKILELIQEKIMQMRMIPLHTLSSRLKRIVHDEAIKEGKNAQFHLQGGETPIDKVLLEIAEEALGHLVRNAVVHGIEFPDIRRRNGKNPAGQILLSASTRQNEVIIEIEDDGAGIDPDQILRTAGKKGINVTSDLDPYSILFLPGFSVKEEADLSSGRGVGMSAVMEAVRKVGGAIETESEPGLGTCFRLRLPLSVSIIRAMILEADGERYALPISFIVESLRAIPEKLHTINQRLIFQWRDEVIPVIDLGCYFETTENPREHGVIVIIDTDGRRRGILVDNVLDIRETVVKKVDQIFNNPSGVIGFTILGDGCVIMILDPLGISMNLDKLRLSDETAE